MQQSAAMCSASQRESTVLHQPMPAAPAEYSLHSISGAKWARLNCPHTEAIRRIWTCRRSHMQLRWLPLTTRLDYHCPIKKILLCCADTSWPLLLHANQKFKVFLSREWCPHAVWKTTVNYVSTRVKHAYDLISICKTKKTQNPTKVQVNVIL